LQTGLSTGLENNHYHWQVEVSPFTLNTDHTDIKTVTAELFKVKVTVSWDDGHNSDRQLELITLKLINKAL